MEKNAVRVILRFSGTWVQENRAYTAETT